jgi:hypothetical protein
MHDPVDIRLRIERLVARVDRRDDYGQLLARGEVIHRVEDVGNIEAWRGELKRQARADKIKLRTGANDRVVWAALVRIPREEWKDEMSEYSNLLSRAVPLAVERRHEPSVALRDGDEGDLRMRPMRRPRLRRRRKLRDRRRAVRGRVPA